MNYIVEHIGECSKECYLGDVLGSWLNGQSFVSILKQYNALLCSFKREWNVLLGQGFRIDVLGYERIAKETQIMLYIQDLSNV